jgi:uncharacterized protein YbaP (TraB family)
MARAQSAPFPSAPPDGTLFPDPNANAPPTPRKTEDLMRALFTALLLLASPVMGAPAMADCAGQNLLATMPADQRMALEAAAESMPFHAGNFWTATRAGQTITLAGTYHLDDPRHAANIAALSPSIDAATTVLVEAGPEEEAALKALLARDPSLMILTDTSLAEALGPTDWALLSEALGRRGIPAFFAAKFRPWYVSMMLALPACNLPLDKGEGLDALVIARATAQGIPVKALEPFDTALRIFDQLSFQDQLSMIRSALGVEALAADYMTTLADSYFDGQSRLMWEFMRAETASLPGYTPEQVAREYAAMEEAMINARNRGWIDVLEQAAQDGPVFAAFGALHLPGPEGVPALLQARGWTLTPLSFP